MAARNKKLLLLDARLGVTLKHQLRLYRKREKVELRVYTTPSVKGVQSAKEPSLPEKEKYSVVPH